jgi:hypothetical protein
MSTLYLAARFERQDELRGYAARLRAAGHVVTSRWLDVTGKPPVPTDSAECARVDLDDILAARWFVLFTDDEPGRGGKDFETGWALALGVSVRIVGPRVHVFHYLPAITCYDTVDEFMAAMGA